MPSSVTIMRLMFIVAVFGMVGATAYHQHRRGPETDRLVARRITP